MENVLKNDTSKFYQSRDNLKQFENQYLVREYENSRSWWSTNSKEESLDSRNRWSYGSDVSDPQESSQSRLCCSPVDEFESTLSSENNDLIVVNNIDDKDSQTSLCNYSFNQVSPANSEVSSSSSNLQKSEKISADDTADDEVIDYSKRYTTESSLVREKRIQSKMRPCPQNSIRTSNQKKREISSNETKGNSFSDYAETDLDQPTDYSLRYADEDIDEDEKPNCRFFVGSVEQEDTVMTFYTEGTPHEGTPYNYSNSTSISDLRCLDDKESYSLNLLSRKTFARSETNITQDDSIKRISERNCVLRMKKNLPSKMEGNLREMDLQKRDNYEENKQYTLSRSPTQLNNHCKIEKSVSFTSEDACAQETPLMFSRSSSIDSLSEFEQELKVPDDHGSVISDFSHRTSVVVSPSELPDSPTQIFSPNLVKFNNSYSKHTSNILRPIPQGNASERNKSSSENSEVFKQKTINFIDDLRSKSTTITHINAPNSSVLKTNNTRDITRKAIDLTHQHKMEYFDSIKNKTSSLISTAKNAPYFSITQRMSPLGHSLENADVNFQSNGPPQINSLIKQSIFEDKLRNFKEESSSHRAHSTVSSLSALTIDDDCIQEFDNEELAMRMNMLNIRRNKNSYTRDIPDSSSIYFNSHSDRKREKMEKRMLTPSRDNTEKINTSMSKFFRDNRTTKEIQNSHDTEYSIFEDRLVRFREESLENKGSVCGSSLSSLTIDDDIEECDNRNIMDKIATIRVRTSALGMQQAPSQLFLQNDSDNKMHSRSPESSSSIRSRHESEDEDENLLSAYVNTKRNDIYRHNHNNRWHQDNNRNFKDNDLPTKYAPAETYSNSKFSSTNRNQNVPLQIRFPKLNVNESQNDTTQTFCTENTPTFISRAGSQSNLSTLSMLSMPDGLESSETRERVGNDRIHGVSEASSESSENEEKYFEDCNTTRMRIIQNKKRIDVSPFESQNNLHQAVLNEMQREETNKKFSINIQEKFKTNSQNYYKESDGDEIPSEISESSDDEIALEECIRSGLSKVTRRQSANNVIMEKR